jgi:hypothetical protein
VLGSKFRLELSPTSTAASRKSIRRWIRPLRRATLL